MAELTEQQVKGIARAYYRRLKSIEAAKSHSRRVWKQYRHRTTTTRVLG